MILKVINFAVLFLYISYMHTMNQNGKELDNLGGSKTFLY